MIANLVAVLLALLPMLAHAADRNPMDYSLRQYGFLLSIALLGGFVAWVDKVRKGQAAVWNLMQLIGELATSAFAGLLCFWICEWAELSQLLTIALVAIAGHMGTRAIALFEDWAAKRWTGLVPPKPEKEG